MTKSVNLPAPYLGVNEKIPKAILESPYCENLFNFNVNQAGISLRNGDSKYAKFTINVGSNTNNGFGIYGDTKLFLLVTNTTTTKVDFYDVDAGTIAYSTPVYSTTGAYQRSTYFNNYLFFFSRDLNLTPGTYYNGSAFGTIGYTGTSFNPIGGGNVYKNRHYMIQYNSAAYWYSDIDAITGAVTKVDLSSIITNNTTLANICSVTLADNVSTEILQVFIFSNGEILFYSGRYPDSADWRLVGQAKIAQLISFYDSTISYQGDTLVLCDIGVVSLRDLFLKGSQNASILSVNSTVEKTWSRLIQLARVSNNMPIGPINAAIQGVYDEKNNRIIIAFPFYESSGVYATGNFFFIFNTQLQSWFFHRSYGTANLILYDIIKYKNKILYTVTANNSAVAIVLEKEGGTDFQDRNSLDTASVSYDYEMLSAPIPFPKTAVYEANQIEPILESDLYAQTNYNFVVDFGRQTSGNQPTDASTTAVAKPAVNVGMQNITFVQVKMSGTTAASKTVGLDLYSYNVWYDAGEIASR